MDTSIDSNTCPSIDSTLFDAMLENCCLSDEDLSQEIMQIEEYINSCDNTCADRQKQINESVIPVVRPIATYNKCLNDIELNRLQELSAAVKCLHCLVCPSTQHIIEYPTLEEYYTNGVGINLTNGCARQFVQFCKGLSAFQDICEQDQLALVKSGYYESVQWQNLSNISSDHKSWVLNLVCL